MKKIISQISLILLIITIGFASVLISNVFAADSIAGIGCVASVNEGENFTVSLVVPDYIGAFAVQADITVKFSNGTSESKTLAYMGEYGDKTITFNAKVAGTAQITASNIIISDNNANSLEEGRTKSHTLNIVAKAQETPSEPTTPTTPQTPTTPSTPSTPETPATPSTPTPSEPSNNNSSTGENNSSNTNNTTTEPKFTDVNETVYTTSRCNARKSYSTESEKITTFEKNSKLTRKGVGDNGWSKIEYNGQIVYVFSQYLTTTEPEEEKELEVVFKDTSENLYAKQNCNLRKSWSTESEKVGYLTKGQAVERTGYADNGWSRIKYNGEIVYVASRLLVVEKPEYEIDSTIINENVTNNEETENENQDPTKMSEEEKLKELQEEIGVLPEVGTNIANIIYIVVTFIAMCGVIIGIYYIKKIK